MLDVKDKCPECNNENLVMALLDGGSLYCSICDYKWVPDRNKAQYDTMNGAPLGNTPSIMDAEERVNIKISPDRFMSESVREAEWIAIDSSQKLEEALDVFQSMFDRYAKIMRARVLQGETIRMKASAGRVGDDLTVFVKFLNKEPRWHKDDFGARIIKPPVPTNPVFQADDGWYFLDETWADCCGPYGTEAMANKAAADYARWLQNGPEK
jgi:hypothetical protein